ncbi:MAG: hypothetical protein OEL20_11275 [Sulfuritalea sp.]|nr:hypothetical protein [Sulfuritalea sp.]
MALRDPLDKSLQRMESRRFAMRCEAQISSIERADTLREIGRLATSITLPYSIAEDYGARDALRLVRLRAEDRARELIEGQIQGFARAEHHHRAKLKRMMLDAWTHLTGPLGHLRSWAHNKLVAAEQQLG